MWPSGAGRSRTEVQPRLEAPISKGQKVGEVIVELDGDLVARQPLVALEDLAEGGLWRGMVDTVLLLLE